MGDHLSLIEGLSARLHGPMKFRFEYIAFRDFRPDAALLTGLIPALVPYLLLRGPANRLTPRKAKGGKP